MRQDGGEKMSRFAKVKNAEILLLIVAIIWEAVFLLIRSPMT
jgi:hypothetical protein